MVSSFCGLWTASTLRTVPERERMTTDWVVAPSPK